MRIGKLTISRVELRRVIENCDVVGTLRWLVRSAIGSQKLVRVTVRGQPIWVRPLTPDLEVALDSFAGEFETVLKSVVRAKHGLIIDAGGYIGTAAIIFAKNYPEARIVTLEPSKSNYAVLVRNTSQYKNIFPLNCAIGATTRVRALKDRGTGQWGYTMVDKSDDISELQVIDHVQSITVGDVLTRFRCDGIDIFKIDIEGSEQELLSGQPVWLNYTEALAIELHDRIIEGCTQKFLTATEGRLNAPCGPEKFLSVRQPAVH